MCTENIRALSHLEAAKNAFFPKPDGHTDGRTEISSYRLASLLKNMQLKLVV